MPEHQAVVEAHDLRVYHPAGSVFARRRWVAGPITLAVHRNEFVGLAGPSGSGKTSIGKAILNLLPTWEGDVFWNGRHVRRAPCDPSGRTLAGSARNRRSHSIRAAGSARPSRRLWLSTGGMTRAPFDRFAIG